MIYSLARITKKFGERTVLNINALEIEEGNIYALMGPNGAGKTTLISILAFLEQPTAGSIYFRSKPVCFSESFLQPLRKQVVMVNQHPILFTTTVYKNMEFGLKIRKIQKKKRDHMIEETLDLVGMKHFLNADAHRLSGGETQRIVIARALVLSPQVLLCDEPLSSIDLENQAAVMNILRQINEQKNITILFTTHERTQAMSLAHHTLFLDNGLLTAADRENQFFVNNQLT